MNIVNIDPCQIRWPRVTSIEMRDIMMSPVYPADLRLYARTVWPIERSNSAWYATHPQTPGAPATKGGYHRPQNFGIPTHSNQNCYQTIHCRKIFTGSITPTILYKAGNRAKKIFIALMLTRHLFAAANLVIFTARRYAYKRGLCYCLMSVWGPTNKSKSTNASQK